MSQMIGIAKSVRTSGRLLEGLEGGLALARFFPFERRQLGDLVVGHVGQPLQDVSEVSAGIDIMHSAVLDPG